MTALTIVLTGASGGIGSAVAKMMSAAGHRLILVGRNPQPLNDLRDMLDGSARHTTVVADLLQAADRKRLVTQCKQDCSKVDVLINNAGVSHFGLLENISDQAMADMLNTNVLAPVLIVRDLLPLLSRSSNATIINIGSTFGSIGYPGFSGYSASKFALRGFTEALRRELAEQLITVHYLAPRAVDTPMNSASVKALNAELGNAMDPPEIVAAACHALLKARDGRNRYLGWPERFFVRINALIPALVDVTLRKQLRTIQKYSRPEA
ncbi:3-oxoacyl-[acyl-carrier-protein] reductase FabG [Zhongshania aliphaticivorans]|uniref:3-oxoacyl-[acyl-carrier-protein] reductase FabG n=1 Tax=Zhongshania aliphaticivorans TaxID=1470434 RepID=A0A5S9MYL8_9GAMM|nr:SDR family oxidoreductase [Zhongshania aliphaticivorans]CAA0082307.1 3-oxoacyl-[acyl-carrier-protein] reductase FabG [Zhongshania aliphaticivorans]CAA0084314.1 3-oxoacyl-[acyl-carrier-protein] reductase FabG [Zhongshania aliphaticivorans]